jgi:hypothetical protein
MAIPGWQEELIQAAAKWPRGFRACLRAGIWELLGAPDTVQQEFRQWAERIVFPERLSWAMALMTASSGVPPNSLAETQIPLSKTTITAVFGSPL